MIPLAKTKKICRICEKEYTPCGYCEGDKMAFHYRTICCSRSCAEVYLKRVLEAREKAKADKNSKTLQKENDVVDTKPTVEDMDDITVDELDNSLTNQSVSSIEEPQEKPKRKYVRKRAAEAEEKNSEESEQID